MEEKGKGKSKGNTVSLTEELVKPIIEEAGVSLWDVQFVKEGASWILRIIIEKEEGITFDDCEKVSRPLDKKLDEKDFITQGYFLEVTSPGLERELTKDWHFKRYEGAGIKVRFIRPVEGEKELFGELEEKTKEGVTLKIKGTEKKVTIGKENIAFVRLDEGLDF